MCHGYVFVFFFKQKTAYEMRISDWSSDVCSSDLTARRRTPLLGRQQAHDRNLSAMSVCSTPRPRPFTSTRRLTLRSVLTASTCFRSSRRHARSEELRVGKECVSSCSCCWSPFLSQTNILL